MIDDFKSLDLLWDENSSAYEPVRLDMIGGYVSPCEVLVIEDDDKVMHIDTFSDKERLRALKFILASGKEAWFGYKFNEEDVREKMNEAGTTPAGT